MKKRFLAGILTVGLILSAIPTFADTPSDESDLALGVPEITVNGEKVDLTKLQVESYIFADGDNVMVPLRAVSEKMGFTVDWNGDEKSVEIYDDEWEVKIYIDNDSYIGFSKAAVGMTAPQSYGSAPQLVDSTTYVPAKMFELLDYTYTAIGQFVNFNIIDEPKTDELVDGGWGRPESITVTEKVKSLLDKATNELDGAEYTPIAYLGNQIVAGTNHCILCKITPVIPNPASRYALVYLYEDLEGNVEITSVLDSGVSINSTAIPGGWYETASPVISDELRAYFNKAAANKKGAKYTAVVVLAEQVVAGMNYCFLSEIKNDGANSNTKLALVYLYVDLNGNSEITDIIDFK